MYRQTDDRKVWYEWMAEVYAVERPQGLSASTSGSPVMSGGKDVSEGVDSSSSEAGRTLREADGSYSCSRRIKVGMSDLHSSVKEGCLM